MTFGRWLLGVALLTIVVVALGAGARAARRRALPELGGPVAVLADAVLALGALVVVCEVLGVAGILEAATVVVALVLAGVAGVLWGRGATPRPARTIDDAYPGAASALGSFGPAATWASVAGAALVAAAWVRRSLVSYDLGIGGVDSLWYHLPFAAQFAQDGSLRNPAYVDLEFLTAFYPANAELLHAVGLLLFDGDAVSPLLSVAALGLGLLGGWCIGRPFGVAPATLLAAALALGVPAMFDSQAGEAKNDAAALAFLLASVALLVSAPRGEGAGLAPRGKRAGVARRSDRAGATWALAGVAGGLALGTKLSLLAPVGALALAAAAVGRGAGRWAFAAGAAVTGSYWYLRDLWSTGNPLPWLDLGPLPNPDPARSEDSARTLASYLFDGDAWSTYFLPALDDVLGPLWFAIAGLAALGAVLAVVRGDGMIRALGVVAIVAAVAYVVTPSSAAGPEGRPLGFGINVRYAIPALVLGLCLLPIVARRASAVIAAGLAVALLATQLGPDVIWAAEHRRKAVALLLAALVVAALVAWLRPRRTVLLAGAAATAVAAVPVAWSVERDYVRRQYAGTRLPYTSWAAFGMTPVYAWARAQHGARIAITGTTGAFFQYPLNGPHLDNRVELLGDHGARGSFSPLRDCAAFARALDGSTHVVTTPYLDIWDPYRPKDAPEDGWARRLGARRVVASGRVNVYELRGTRGCEA